MGMKLLTFEQVQLANALFGAGAVKFGEFRLKVHEADPDVSPSPVYLDIRAKDHPKGGTLTAEIVQMIGEQLWHLAEEKLLKFDRVAGVPHAGDPLAKAFVDASHGLFMPLQLTKIDTGERRKIEGKIQGHWNPGQTVLLIDDVVSSGALSKFEAIEVLEKHGLAVRDIMVVVDREQGGAEALAKRGYALYAIFKLSDLLDWYFVQGRITSAQRDKIMRYLALQPVSR